MRTIMAAARLVVPLAAIALIAGTSACGGSKTDSSAATFTVGLAPASLSVAQGGTAQAAVSLSRSNFKDSIHLELLDVPGGVSIECGEYDVVGNGTTMTVTPALSAAPGQYSVTVRATAGGITKSVTLSLTVKPGNGADFAVDLSPATLTVAQGASATTQVVLTRTNYSGAVALSVTGAPAGVTAALSDSAPMGNSTNLTVSAAATVAPGQYTLKVNGAGGGMARTGDLYLTVTSSATGAFTLSLAPAAVSLPPGGGPVSVTVTVDRAQTFTGGVTLALEAPNGVATGSFAPNPATGGSATLNISAAATAAPGSYTVVVRGTSGANSASASLAFTVTAPATVLLVDDDRSENNWNPADATATPSYSDTLFRSLLHDKGIAFNTYVVPSGENGPSAQTLRNYTTVIWYTGSNYGGSGNIGTISSTDEGALKAFLDQGGRRLIAFANSYIYDLPDVTWTSVPPGTFLADYIGAAGADYDVLNRVTFTATGVGAADGFTLSVGANARITSYTDVINPGVGCEPLITVHPADGNPAATAAAAVGMKHVGTAGTSTVVYVGFAFENIGDGLAPKTTQAELFDVLLAY